MTERPNGWSRFLPLLIVLGTGLIGYGILQGDVRSIRKDVDQKASREVVEVQFSAIMRELQALRADVQRIPR